MSEAAPSAIEWSESVLRAVRGSIIAGFGLALAGFLISFVGSGLSFGKALLHGLAVLAVLVVAPTLALLAHPNRPLMLLPAGVIGALGISGLLSVLGFAFVPLGFIWLWAYAKVAPSGRWFTKATMILVPLLWLPATATLWIHVDPVCEQRLQDGTTVEVDPATRGYESGWAWEMGSSFSSSSGTLSGEVVSEACTSNALVAWETGSAILLGGAAVLVGLWRANAALLPMTP